MSDTINVFSAKTYSAEQLEAAKQAMPADLFDSMFGDAWRKVEFERGRQADTDAVLKVIDGMADSLAAYCAKAGDIADHEGKVAKAIEALKLERTILKRLETEQQAGRVALAKLATANGAVISFGDDLSDSLVKLHTSKFAGEHGIKAFEPPAAEQPKPATAETEQATVMRLINDAGTAGIASKELIAQFQAARNLSVGSAMSVPAKLDNLYAADNSGAVVKVGGKWYMRANMPGVVAPVADKPTTTDVVENPENGKEPVGAAA